MREIWSNYYAEVRMREKVAVDTFVLYSLLLLVQTHGIIFVADASDPSRFGEARSLLDQVLSDDRLKEKPLLM